MILGQSKRVGFGRSPALIVVDMTCSLADRQSPFFTEQAEACLTQLHGLVDAAREAGIPRFFTRGGLRYFTAETVKATDAERGSWRFKNEAHNEIRDAGMWEIAGSFDLRPDEVIIEKTKPSAFFGTPLASYLNYLNVDTLIIGGMMTSDCVRCTVVDGFQYNYRVIVPLEGVADRRPKAHESSLEDIDLKYADVMPMADVLAALRRTAGRSAG